MSNDLGLQAIRSSRIAILGTRGIPAQYGGFETFAEQLAIRLVQKGVEVTVFCEAKSDTRTAAYKDVQLRYVSSPNMGPLTTLVYDLICLVRARKDFDVVYMLGYAASPFCWIPRLYGHQVWINMDGIEWKRQKWGWVAKLWLRATEFVGVLVANRIVADAQAIRAHLNKLWPGSAQKTSVIAYGAHVLDARPSDAALGQYGLVADCYYIVVCRLEPENHVREIIEGYLASGSTMPLVIVGGLTDSTGYAQSLMRFEGEKVRFVGAVYDQAVLQALRYFSFGYMHGHSVGGTNPSLLEAMGAGNFILAHDNVFNREVAGGGAQYFSDSTELARRLRGAEAEPNSRDHCRAAAVDRLRFTYSWERITDQYVRLLEGCGVD